ncbi:MAG TPA: NUDIX hydrolase [Rhodocyclaceae bacterium]|nr:NUDIX hydrolase [Rhodocyclaceae bacterium]
MPEEEQNLVEKCLESQRVYSGGFLQVYRDRVRLPNGQESWREYIRHPGAVVVIAQLDSGKLLFERQFRYPLDRVFLELPAGKIDPGEDILATAQRELLEETGHVAGDWRHLGVMHPCIGYSDERIEIFLARDVRDTGQRQLDHNEFLTLAELSLAETGQAIRRGEISDAKTVTAIFWAEKVLNEGW